MSHVNEKVVFFDINENLGVLHFSSSTNQGIDRLDVYPFIPDILKGIKKYGYRLGILADTGNIEKGKMDQVLESSGIFEFFDAHILIYSSVVGYHLDSSRIFNLALNRSELFLNPEQCYFVCLDKAKLALAAASGMIPVPHPKLVLDGIHGSRFRYLRIKAPQEHLGLDWEKAINGLAVVPMFVTGEKGSEIFAVASTSASAALDDLGFEVIRLGAEGNPCFTDLFLIRDSRRDRSGFLTPVGQSTGFSNILRISPHVLCSSKDGLFVEIPAGSAIEDFMFPEEYHGSRKKLLPDPSLLHSLEKNSELAASFLKVSGTSLTDFFTNEELDIIQSISHKQIRYHVERFSGLEPFDSTPSNRITSRHIAHPHNQAAVQILVQDLTKIIGSKANIFLHRFSFQGRTLDNVIAEIPGSDPQEIIVLGAHLDSTAGFTPNYNPRIDPAPGADDDASGMAALLSLAQAFDKLLEKIDKPKRTLRFAFFNAEEVGLLGSAAYARDQSTFKAPIIAMYELDMIGYNREEPKSCEIHAGIKTSPEVEARSVLIAEELIHFMKMVSPEFIPQIYSSNTDPQGDPGDRRSDHGSFQERGYPACLVIEDWCLGPGQGAPEPEMNPNYHRPSDTFVDCRYAAGIARSVAAAVWTKIRA